MGSLLKFRGPNILDGDAWHLAEVDYILSHGRHTPTDRILDVGCGRGGRVRAFAVHGFGNVTGLDATLPMSRQRRTSPGKKVFMRLLWKAPPSITRLSSRYSTKY